MHDVLLISGQGAVAVAREVSRLLRDAGVAHALLEGDSPADPSHRRSVRADVSQGGAVTAVLLVGGRRLSLPTTDGDAVEIADLTGWIERPLHGGGVNQVVRAGATVRRPAGPWTPAVHRLLAHVAAAGFRGAPRAHGLDAEGREVLDFVQGEVAHYPLPDHAWSDATLREVGRLLRAYHDATAGCPAEGPWYLPAREPAEVICHGDVAPYNTVFRDGLPVAFIDFDTAHPGPRLSDVAYAAYRFVPLSALGNGEAVLTVAEQARRLRLFCDAYGLPPAERAALPAMVRERLHALVDLMRTQAAAGNAAFAQHLSEGHHTLYLTDATHVTTHAASLVQGTQEVSGGAFRVEPR
ncbi:phosphotransferase enzyme family protein [Nonomuraea dietziae]|uniref:phosphotransferase enzyme family protein n=1 Tax=Nonomuraea dietziae TaxID=65515 RepID=UPI0033E281D2